MEHMLSCHKSWKYKPACENLPFLLQFSIQISPSSVEAAITECQLMNYSE